MEPATDQNSPEVQAFFRASTFMLLGDGRQALFWEDKWINEESIGDIAPCLLQLIPAQIQHRQTVRERLENRQWVRSALHQWRHVTDCRD